jgi:PAS domain S-box-containing protein
VSPATPQAPAPRGAGAPASASGNSPGALSDALAAALLEGAGDAVVVADPAGTIRYWNPRAEAMFGHPRERALGSTLDLIIPERLRDRHWEGYRHTMATGETKYGGSTLAVPALRADGSRISIEFTVALLHDEAGGLAGIGAILRDVTERWEQDRALRRRLAELEKTSAQHSGG